MKRTDTQNKAMHKFFSLLADELNEKGLDARVVLKPSYEIWWTSNMIKEHIWRPIQKAMFSKESTTELDRIEVGKVHQVIENMLADKFPKAGLHIPFPEDESKYDVYGN